MGNLRPGQTLPARALTTVWPLGFPVAVHLLITAGALPPQTTAWAHHAGVLAVSYLAAALVPLVARLVGVGRLALVPGWAAGLAVIVLTSAVQWAVAHRLADAMGVSLLGPTTLSALTALSGWVLLGVLGWALAGTVHTERTRRDTLRSLSSKLHAMESSDRVRLEGALRGLLGSVGRQVNRVVTDMTLGSPVDDALRTRSLPDSDQDLVVPLTTRVSERWAPQADTAGERDHRASAVTATNPLQHATPPGPLTVATLMLGVAVMGARLSSVAELLAVAVAAIITASAAAVAWWWIPRRVPITAQRLIATGASSVIVAGLAIWLPAFMLSQFSGQATLVWADVPAIVVGILAIIGAGALSRMLASEREVMADRVTQQAGRCDDVARKVGVIHHVEPRVLYSATLGTLIRTTVDLTATEVTEDRRDAALAEMATKITAELESLRVTLMPLPDDHILAIVGLWRAALGVNTDVGPRVFSRISWTAEGIRELREVIAQLMVWAVQQPGPPRTLRLDVEGAEVSLSITLPRIAAWQLAGDPGSLISEQVRSTVSPLQHPAGHAAPDTEGEPSDTRVGSVLGLRYAPRNTESLPPGVSFAAADSGGDFGADSSAGSGAGSGAESAEKSAENVSTATSV